MGKPDVHSPDMFYPKLAKSLMLLTISSSPGQSLVGTRRTIDHTGAWWWGIRCGTRGVVSLTKSGLCLSFRWCTINFSMYLKWPTLLRALNIICLIISAEMRYWTSWCGDILNNVLSFNVIDRIFLPSKRFYIASQLKILCIGVITYRPFSALGSKLGQRVKSPNFKEYGSFWSNVHPCTYTTGPNSLSFWKADGIIRSRAGKSIFPTNGDLYCGISSILIKRHS